MDSDIVLGEGEEEKYHNGIKIDVNHILIDGNGHTIDARGKVRIFEIESVDVDIFNITFKNAFFDKYDPIAYDGGAILNDGTACFKNCNFINNSASFGSAINNNYKLCILDCNFDGNVAILTDYTLDSDYDEDREYKSAVIYSQYSSGFYSENCFFKNNVTFGGFTINILVMAYFPMIEIVKFINCVFQDEEVNVLYIDPGEHYAYIESCKFEEHHKIDVGPDITLVNDDLDNLPNDLLVNFVSIEKLKNEYNYYDGNVQNRYLKPSECDNASEKFESLLNFMPNFYLLKKVIKDETIFIVRAFALYLLLFEVFGYKNIDQKFAIDYLENNINISSSDANKIYNLLSENIQDFRRIEEIPKLINEFFNK